MHPDIQFLPPDKRREEDPGVLTTHLETLLLLTTTRQGREALREVNVYPLVRETHSTVEDEGVREACERFVGVLMRDEEVENRDGKGRLEKGGGKVSEVEEEEEDDEDEERGIVDVI